MRAKDRSGLLLLDLTVLVVVFLFGFVSLSSVQCASADDVWQYIVLYKEEGGGGETLVIMEEDSYNLESLGFLDAKAECHTGAWVLLLKSGGSAPLGASGCKNRADKPVAARFAGDPSNYTRDSLTLFSGEIWSGTKEVFLTDGNVKLAVAGSMVATGASDWTIYKDPNYAGDSHCIKFKFKDYALFSPIGETGGFPTGVKGDWIKSVRKGCQSTSVFQLPK